MLFSVELNCRWILVFCLLPIVRTSSVSEIAQPIGVNLNTKLGQIAGIATVVKQTPVASFRGIPYAKPPTGELRFKKPQPFGKLGIRDALQFGSACPQIENGTYFGSEDCLTLNIFTSSYMNGDPRVPVLIFIYGGGYLAGRTEIYPGEVLAATQGIVVVTMNYRVNSLGFLSTGDDRLPGNLGLWDQHLAIKWVRDNIEDYGGYATSVTISGESAGGSSALYQALSPRNDLSLFRRVIASSPYATYMTVVNRDPTSVADEFAKSVNCTNSFDLVKCLQEKPAKDLVKASTTMTDVNAFYPMADGDFLSKDLGYLYNNFTKYGNAANLSSLVGNFADYEVFGGFNSQDGLLAMGNLRMINQALTKQDNLDKGVSEMALRMAMQNYLLDFLEVGSFAMNFTTDVLLNYYMQDIAPSASDGRSIEDKRVEAYMEMSGDLALKLPTIKWLQIHSVLSNKPTYMYEFDHKRSTPSLFYEGPDWLRTGANHADDILYVFGLPLVTDNSFGFVFTKEEEAVSKKFMSYWANFVKTGSPGDAAFSEFTYPHCQSYTKFGASRSEQFKYPLSHNDRLWSALQLSLSDI